MVSAWGCEQRLVVGQTATDATSNEITAVPKLLAMLSLKGNNRNMDALNCQRAIAQQPSIRAATKSLHVRANQGAIWR
jgi:predicted transposase YbfD/YdcC